MKKEKRVGGARRLRYHSGMNAEQARQVRIKEILTHAGYRPERETSREAWYCSPFRTEKTPSFKIDFARNAFFDHGEGAGGNALDLAIRLSGGSVADALRWLENAKLAPANPHPDFFKPASLPTTSTANSSAITLKKIQPLQNRALTGYLEQRGIAPALAANHLQEAYFTNKNRPDKNYFALAFANDAGGYELRNAYFQGCAAPKAITTVKGSQPAATLNLFEGFTDFLAALTIAGQTRPEQDTIVLNSLALLEKTNPQIAAYPHITLFLDNDEAGHAAAQKFPNAQNMAALHYPDYKDVNEWLVKAKISPVQQSFRL